MTEQSEALRLAYWLERDGANCQQHINAAAELRRSHSKIVDLEESVRILLTVVSERDRIEAQRDALLEALKEAVDVCGWPNVAFFHKALAAIKQAEENT